MIGVLIVLVLGVGFWTLVGKAAINTQRAEQQKISSAPAGSVLVRTYKTTQLFEQDANRFAVKGWSIQTQSSRTKKFSATTGVLTNKGLITVTYVRERVSA